VWSLTVSVAECDRNLSAVEKTSGLMYREYSKASSSTCFIEVSVTSLNATASIPK